MRPKYVLHEGMVTSKYDGQRHFVGAVQLAQLYGVRMEDCVIMSSNMGARKGLRIDQGLIHLHPRYDGNYTLPE